MKTLLTMLLALTAGNAMADRIVFDMSVFGLKFGQMVLTRTVVNDSTEVYTLDAKGKTDFLWMKREEQSIHRVEYRHGRLFSSDYEYLNKGVREKWSTIRFDGEQYQVMSNEGKRAFKDAPDYSLIKLYFDPNWKRDKVFCEEDCTYAQMKRNEQEGTITITCQDGSRSTYHVSNGVVRSMDIHLAVATVKLTRVN